MKRRSRKFRWRSSGPRLIKGVGVAWLIAIASPAAVAQEGTSPMEEAPTEAQRASPLEVFGAWHLVPPSVSETKRVTARATMGGRHWVLTGDAWRPLEDGRGFEVSGRARLVGPEWAVAARTLVVKTSVTSDAGPQILASGEARWLGDGITLSAASITVWPTHHRVDLTELGASEP